MGRSTPAKFHECYPVVIVAHKEGIQAVRLFTAVVVVPIGSRRFVLHVQQGSIRISNAMTEWRPLPDLGLDRLSFLGRWPSYPLSLLTKQRDNDSTGPQHHSSLYTYCTVSSGMSSPTEEIYERLTRDMEELRSFLDGTTVPEMTKAVQSHHELVLGLILLVVGLILQDRIMSDLAQDILEHLSIDSDLM